MFGALAKSALGGYLDLVLDPVTGDYIDTEDGEWLESADSRMAVIIALETEYGASPFDWTHGTRIKAALRNSKGDPLSMDFVGAETRRALSLLVELGIIGELRVQVTDRAGNYLVDESGRGTVLVYWRDLASGSPVDLVFSPEGN